jgi:hypothetical protein
MLQDQNPDEVVGRFIRNGRLVTLPSKRTNRLLVLDYLARLFEPGRRYPEEEVNRRLAAFHPDVATLRRHLVDEQFLERGDEAAQDGRSVKVYWRVGGTFPVD